MSSVTISCEKNHDRAEYTIKCVIDTSCYKYEFTTDLVSAMNSKLFYSSSSNLFANSQAACKILWKIIEDIVVQKTYTAMIQNTALSSSDGVNNAGICVLFEHNLLHSPYYLSVPFFLFDRQFKPNLDVNNLEWMVQSLLRENQQLKKQLSDKDEKIEALEELCGNNLFQSPEFSSSSISPFEKFIEKNKNNAFSMNWKK